MDLLILIALLIALPGISDRSCGATDLKLIETERVEVIVRCKGVENARTINLSVDSMLPMVTGGLQRVSLGFCGEILDVKAPEGWSGAIRHRRASFGEPAEVEWRKAPAPTVEGGVLPIRTAGFSVTLQPGWRRAITFGIEWERSADGSLSPHDCGEYPRRRPQPN